jgi:outer membrane protein assembly factor BamD (BamD/ComL family)
MLCAGCNGEKPSPEADKYSDPRFKESQRTKAVAAYMELVENYPDSKFAERARQRLREIQQ